MRTGGSNVRARENSPERIAELRAIPYADYLQTPEWRRRRNRALSLAAWTCQRAPCKTQRELEVHHKTYERLGAELDSDLEVLCGRCHRQQHVQQMEGSVHGVYLKLVRQALREHPFDTIADLSEHAKQLCSTHQIPYDGPTIHRAIGLLTGARVIPISAKVWPPNTTPDSVAFTAEVTHIILTDLEKELGVVLGNVLKTLPDGILPHDRDVIEQWRNAKKAEQPRRPQGPDDIFQSKQAMRAEDADMARVARERAEIEQMLKIYRAEY